MDILKKVWLQKKLSNLEKLHFYQKKSTHTNRCDIMPVKDIYISISCGRKLDCQEGIQIWENIQTSHRQNPRWE